MPHRREHALDRVRGSQVVPMIARRRIFDVHVLADEVRIFADGALVAAHAPLEGRGEKRLILTRAGDRVVRRSLDFYAAVGRRLAPIGGVR
jgi:hypothetical protein